MFGVTEAPCLALSRQLASFYYRRSKNAARMVGAFRFDRIVTGIAGAKDITHSEFALCSRNQRGLSSILTAPEFEN